MRGNNPMFQLKLHVSVNISVNSRRICTKPSRSRVNFSRQSEWGATTPCFNQNCMFRSISQWILDGTTTNHHKPWYGPLQMMTWIITNHYKSPQVYHDMNHHKSLQITTNHDINHHEPWQKPAQSMTWITTNHHKPWHEPSWWPKKSYA